MKKYLGLLLALMTLLLAGCGTETRQAGGDVKFFQGQDDLQRQVVLSAKPERVVVLSPSFLEICAALSAPVVGRPTSKVGEIPPGVEKAEEIGMVYNINLEKAVSLQPDLVIGGESMHGKFLPVFEANNIPVLVLRLKSYEDIKDKTLLLGRALGQEEKAAEIVQDMDSRIENLKSRIPQKKVRIMILHSTAKSVTVELDNSIAGSAAKILGLENLAAGSQPLDDHADQTPYSLEKIVELNPDIIFFVTMGKLPELKKKMAAEMAANPAWNAVQAVKAQKIYYLPQELFLLNPGLHYPEAVEYMAKIVYPEVFNND